MPPWLESLGRCANTLVVDSFFLSSFVHLFFKTLDVMKKTLRKGKRNKKEKDGIIDPFVESKSSLLGILF
jgi:hypothetical protein